jgi:PKD repeat protein
MRLARHTSLVLVLGTALSLATASAASAADFTVSPPVPNPGETVTFTPDLSDAELLLTDAVGFQFGDAAPVLDDTAPYAAQTNTYNSAGMRTVTMHVVPLVGETELITKEIRVNAAPVARFERNVMIPNVGQTVRFDAGTTTDDAPLDSDSYDWDFDDNGSFETNNQRAVQRSFASPGNKVVSLRVTDSGGRTDIFATTLHVNFPPVAALTFSPLTPYVTDLISFTSLSDDRDGPLASEQWDLDGDGQYDDAGGAGVSRRFPSAGLHTVRLRVMDTLGRVSTTATTFRVLAENVPPPVKMRPWPKIRIVGFAGSKRIRLDLLTVKTLRGATVKVRCSGKGCPRRRAVSTRASKGLVRLRWLERRLRPGTHLFVAITYPNKIGRYERILLRRNKRPLRRMQCLWPGEPKARACP